MTITSDKREAFPLRYARKDARTAIYRAVYGPMTSMERGDRDDRHCTYHQALETWKGWRDTAALPFWKAQDIEARIELLKRRPSDARLQSD